MSLKQHPDVSGLYKEDFDADEPTLVELVRKSTKMGSAKSSLQRVVDDLGTKMIEYTDWFFEGTEITTEGTSGSSEDVAGA